MLILLGIVCDSFCTEKAVLVFEVETIQTVKPKMFAV